MVFYLFVFCNCVRIQKLVFDGLKGADQLDRLPGDLNRSNKRTVPCSHVVLIQSVKLTKCIQNEVSDS